jgi:CRP/FNR family cyclic AMP-dependent transcriptional regulator
MALLSNRDLLRRVPLFSSLTDDQISLLENSFVKRKFKTNSLVFRQGEQSESFFCILVGRAHVVMRDTQGREVISETLKQGDYFGEMSLIDVQPHSASVRAIAVCELLMIERDVFASCLPKPETPAFSIMLSLVSRLRKADKKIETIALQSGRERILGFLREASEPDDRGNMVIARKLTASHISKNIGASRELTARIVKSLKDEGLLVIQDNGSYQIRDEQN